MRVGARDWQGIAVGVLQVGLVLTCVFSVATAFDQWHRYLELFSHFRLQYLGASVLLALAFLVLRRRAWFLLGLAAVLFNGWFVVPWYLTDERVPGVAAEGGVTVKILLANVLISNDNAAPFLALIGDERPDLIVIQEATPAWIDALQGIAADYPHSVLEPRDDPFGIALYSRFPLDATAVIESAPFGTPDLVATAVLDGARLRIISTHPVPPIGAEHYRARNMALDRIAKLAARAPPPVVVVGDLNTTVWAQHYRRFVKVSGLRHAGRGFGIRPTWPLFLLPAMIPIDHCLVSDDIGVLDFSVGADIDSDHLPILVTLAVPATG